VLVSPAIVTIVAARFVTGIGFSLYTVAFISLISSRTPPGETGAVLALYSVTITGLVSILASPLAGALFDALGGRWLYAFSAIGYAAATAVLWLTRPRQAPG
jgi:MFS family permease